MVLKKFFFPSYQQYLTNVTYVPQEYLPGVKAAGAWGWQPTTILFRCHEIWEP